MANTPSISVLIPTRGRASLLVESVISLLKNANSPASLEVLLALDQDDIDTQRQLKIDSERLAKEYGCVMSVHVYPRFGYKKLNEYLNELSKVAKGDWLFFWNDDAVMLTSGWDTEIRKQHLVLQLLRMPCKNMEHPFALMPIVPREWVKLFGTLSPAAHTDWWVYNVCAPLGLVRNISVTYLHNRADVSGLNNDSTYAERDYSADGQDPTNPYDYIHPDRQRDLYTWRLKLGEYYTRRYFAVANFFRT